MSSKASTKTNAARLLDSLGIAYELRAYEVDPADLTAISVAKKIGLPLEQVFKTLLTQTSGNTPLFAVVPGDAELDLKKARLRGRRAQCRTRSTQGSRTAHRLHPRRRHCACRQEALSRLSPTKPWSSAMTKSPSRPASAACRLLLSPADYLRATQATLADLTKVPGPRTSAGTDA